MRTEVTLISHKAHTQQAVVQLLRLLAEHQVNCKQLSMLTHVHRPYLALVLTFSTTDNPWLDEFIEGGLDRMLASLVAS